MQINLNGETRDISAPAEMPLLWVLRDRLDLTGTKFGCGHGVCGACIVSVDGAQEHACQVTCGDVTGKSITTIEGLEGPVADALFEAWETLDVSQCGFCQPAQLMSASILLQRNPAPSDADIDEAMKHNLCRCATYARIRQAIHQASATLTATHAGATA
ncbi:MAG: (2Fe-2S)-binding protein [Variovorax sp.]|jgi:isoquinoline 1-oxidoreductase alpha subunit|nr:(2Fe-2S)-binding protein [Variovorax sp.]